MNVDGYSFEGYEWSGSKKGNNYIERMAINEYEEAPETLILRLLNEHGSIRAVARELLVFPSQLSKWMKEHGIESARAKR